MDKKLEARIARLEKLLLNSKSVKNESVLDMDDDEYSKLAEMLSSMNVSKMLKALRMGADPNMSSVKHNHGNGSTALRAAAIFGEYEPAKILIDAGADVNMIDPVGNTPLDYALENDHHDMIILLLDNGAKSGSYFKKHSR